MGGRWWGEESEHGGQTVSLALDMLSLGCRGPQERVSHKTSGEPRVWGSQDGPELVGAEDTSAFTLVTSLALLIKFSASFLQCLWKYNFVREIHVQLRIF